MSSPPICSSSPLFSVIFAGILGFLSWNSIFVTKNFVYALIHVPYPSCKWPQSFPISVSIARWRIECWQHKLWPSHKTLCSRWQNFHAVIRLSNSGWRTDTAQKECAPCPWNVLMIAARACFTFRGASTGLRALLMLIVCKGERKHLIIFQLKRRNAERRWSLPIDSIPYHSMPFWVIVWFSMQIQLEWKGLSPLFPFVYVQCVWLIWLSYAKTVQYFMRKQQQKHSRPEFSCSTSGRWKIKRKKNIMELVSALQFKENEGVLHLNC